MTTQSGAFFLLESEQMQPTAVCGIDQSCTWWKLPLPTSATFNPSGVVILGLASQAEDVCGSPEWIIFVALLLLVVAVAVVVGHRVRVVVVVVVVAVAVVEIVF